MPLSDMNAQNGDNGPGDLWYSKFWKSKFLVMPFMTILKIQRLYQASVISLIVVRAVEGPNTLVLRGVQYSNIIQLSDTHREGRWAAIQSWQSHQ